jgi:hypothetical protein
VTPHPGFQWLLYSLKDVQANNNNNNNNNNNKGNYIKYNEELQIFF